MGQRSCASAHSPLRRIALGWMTKSHCAVVSRWSTRASRAGFGEFFLDRHLGPTEFDHEALTVERGDASHQILACVIRHASRGDGRRIRLRGQGLNGYDDADL